MHNHSRALLLIFIFFIGFASLLYEIYSVHVLFMFFVKHTQAASVAISSFIAGLAVSSLVFSRLGRQNEYNTRIIFWMQMAAAFYGFFILANYELIPTLLDATGNNIVKVGIMWAYLFIPAFFIGGAFPLINGLYLRHFDNATKDTGIVYFWDMLGAIVGALATGFVLLPYMGLHVTVVVGVAINLLVAFWIVKHHSLRALAVLCLMLVVTHTVTQPTTTHTNEPVTFKETSQLHKRFGKILFEKISPLGTIRVGQRGQQKSLYVNYRSMCRNYSKRTPFLEDDLGYVTMDNLRPGAVVANIGLGCGITAREIGHHANTKRLDIIEINPVILEATSKHFKTANEHVLESEKVHVTIADGAEYMRTTDKKYDAVAIDIEEVSVIYSSPLFTKEYYTIIKSKLNPGGILAHWSFNANPTFSKVMYNTLRAVFPYVMIQTYNKDVVFYASTRPLVIPEISSEDTQKVKDILAAKTDEVNTVESPILERYFDIKKIFYLPDDYREPFIKRNDKLFH